MSSSLVVVIVVLAALIWIGVKYATPKATPVSTDDPLWQEAVGKARSTLPEMTALLAEGRDVWVKFPVTTGGAPEHVWGRVIRRSGDVLECSVETPTVHPSDVPAEGMTEVRLPEIEDWQVELEDGTIRGGFTTVAQAAIATRDGQPVPQHVRDMIGRIRN